MIKIIVTDKGYKAFPMRKTKCKHSWIDGDNEGFYGKELCRFCGKIKHK